MGCGQFDMHVGAKLSRASDGDWPAVLAAVARRLAPPPVTGANDAIEQLVAFLGRKP